MGKENKKLHLDGNEIWSKGEQIGTWDEEFNVVKLNSNKSRSKAPIMMMFKRLEKEKPEFKIIQVETPVVETSNSGETTVINWTAEESASETAIPKNETPIPEKPKGIKQMGNKDPDVIEWVRQYDPDLYNRKNYASLNMDALRKLKDEILKGRYPTHLREGE